MKVLVTGGCGFLGSHVAEYYHNNGDEVVVLDNMTRNELNRTGYNVPNVRKFNYDYLNDKGIKIIRGDVTSINDISDALQECDYIIHTAAQPSMTIAIEYPQIDFRTNVIGTLNLLEAARRMDIPMANCSSVHVYGNDINDNLIDGGTRFKRNPIFISESDKIAQGTVTPLHASKLSAEFYVNAYIDTYGLKATNFRFSGMYGERQFGGEDHGWIANFIIRTLLKLPITVFGTDKQVRDVLHASDAVKAFSAFYNTQEAGTYNVGGGVSNILSIGECLSYINSLTGIEQDIQINPKRLGDLWYFVSDISKIKQALGWEPTVLPHEGIFNAVEWLNTHKEMLL